jgi:hypothetical protein
MTRVLCHLLLALSLFFNGVSIPWARAHMVHETNVEPASSQEMPTAAAHRHHHADATEASVNDAAPAQHEHDKAPCCSGGDCQCGCTMPPAVPLALTLQASRIEPAAPRVFSAAPTVSPRGSPPFRPPAG